MNQCYSLFSVAMMTAACASASRQMPAQAAEARSAAGKAPVTTEALEPAPQPIQGLALDDPDEQTIRELRKAAGLFETFIAKADGNPQYAEAVQKSRDRLDDIDKEIEFLAQGIAERRRP